MAEKVEQSTENDAELVEVEEKVMTLAFEIEEEGMVVPPAKVS